DAHLAAQLRHGQAGLYALERLNDLAIGESGLLHGRNFPSKISTSQLAGFPGGLPSQFVQLSPLSLASSDSLYGFGPSSYSTHWDGGLGGAYAEFFLLANFPRLALPASTKQVPLHVFLLSCLA